MFTNLFRKYVGILKSSYLKGGLLVSDGTLTRRKTETMPISNREALLIMLAKLKSGIEQDLEIANTSFKRSDIIFKRDNDGNIIVDEEGGGELAYIMVEGGRIWELEIIGSEIYLLLDEGKKYNITDLIN